jgi:TolA-binding protein
MTLERSDLEQVARGVAAAGEELHERLTNHVARELAPLSMVREFVDVKHAHQIADLRREVRDLSSEVATLRESFQQLGASMISLQEACTADRMEVQRSLAVLAARVPHE